MTLTCSSHLGIYSYGPRGWLKELKSTQGLQGMGLTPTVAADFTGTGATPQMGYDALGNRTSFTASGFPTGTNTFNGLTSFAYDARDELTGESSARNGSYSASMIYDGVTMNTTTGPGDATYERNLSLVYDTKGDNQIASDRNGYSWAYDGDGNPVTYLSYANTFDLESRMTAYGVPTGGGHARLAMGYDADGMRAWKEPTNLARVYFIYDGSDLVAELNSSGALQTYQTTGADGLISRRSGSSSTFYTFDPAGNLAVVLNSSGTVQGDELFEANGRRDGSYSARPVDFGGQWGYYGDAETALTLLGHRYYDAYAGRFLTRDPIGYDGGVNLYSYTANNYVNEIDPDGTDYLGDVGQVFAGYGDVLNPLNIAKGVAQLATIAGGQGFGTAGTALVNGVYHGLTDWLTTDDPRKFGQSFGTTLLTVSPLIKRIPNPLPFTIEGPWLTPAGKLPTGTTLFKISKTNVQTEAQVCRLDIGKLDDRPTVSQRLKGKFLPHWHRRGPGGIKRQRPWKMGLAASGEDFKHNMKDLQTPLDILTWSVIIAETIDTHIQKTHLGEAYHCTFVEDMAKRDDRLYYPANVKDRDLSAAWNFADSYFDAFCEGFGDMDGIPWPEAEMLLTEVVSKLRNHLSITDKRVLAYAFL